MFIKCQPRFTHNSSLCQGEMDTDKHFTHVCALEAAVSGKLPEISVSWSFLWAHSFNHWAVLNIACCLTLLVYVKQSGKWGWDIWISHWSVWLWDGLMWCWATFVLFGWFTKGERQRLNEDVFLVSISIFACLSYWFEE